MAPKGRRNRGQGTHGDNVTRGGPTNLPQGNPGSGNAGPSNAGYDGPSDVRGRSPSQAGQSQAGRPASRTRSASRGPSTGQQAQRTDPARDPPVRTPRTLLKNLDLGGDAYNVLQGTGYMPTKMMPRPSFGKLGKPATVKINSYLVTNFPTKHVYQYDVLVGSGQEMRGLIKVAMESKAIANAVGPGFIFDGNMLGWSLIDHPKELRITIDLDAEKGVPPRNNKDGTPRENKIRVKITQAKPINLSMLEAYLAGKTEFTDHVLECINFMDHLLRETPKKVHINLRRSYFARAPDRNDTYSVGQGVEAMKGVYQSLRVAEGKKLVVNVDVSNSCFWNQTSFVQLAYQLSNETDRTRFLAVSQKREGQEPPLWQMLRRLAKNKFQVKHGKQTDESRAKQWTMKRLSSHTAKSYKFDVHSKETGETKSITLFDYYLNKYGVRLDNWQLPLIESNKPGVLFPMDICHMCMGQRYPYKLNENQTSAMIKFAVSRPQQRRAGIEHGLNMLKWDQDLVLKNFGLRINREMIETKARVLDPPEVLYAKNNTAKPAYSGRWDLRGKVFFKPNEAPLKSWGVVILSSAQDRRPLVTKEQTTAFLQNFITLYQGHGGNVVNKSPVIIDGIPDAAKAVETAFTAAGNQSQFRPQMMIVILPNKNAEVYQRVKKNLDCRWGVVSQCVQASNVVKNQPQYCSNVLMKFNCKLGGTTCTIKAAKPFFSAPTMVIGADVSHAAPGQTYASMAALCVSMDTTASRYAAGVQTNGYRVEMIQTNVIDSILGPLIQHWMTNVSGGQLPKHVYFFRDGISEGQFGPLLQREVADIKRLFERIAGGKSELVPKFTVVACEKRHHIRFFPNGGVAADKNMNPVPGVIVDHDVTHPFENDVYLCSHAAIQGTARPTHYYMLMDDAKVPVDAFQNMLYQHCYQYQRATTPVSLYPAVYYAHLAAARAIAHINKPEMEKWAERREAKRQGGQMPISDQDSQAEAPKLLEMDNKNRIRYGMWYI